MDAAVPELRIAPASGVVSIGAPSFDEVYEMFKGPVFHFACALTDTAGEAEDLFQETWLRVAQARGRGLPTGGLKAWLFTITANLHRDALRKKRIRRLFLIERGRSMADAGSDADLGWDSGRFAAGDATGGSDLAVCLRRALSRLPDGERRVFVLKDIEGVKHAEIGRMLRMPEATVRTKLHRAVKRLQKELAAFDPAKRGAAAGREETP